MRKLIFNQFLRSGDSLRVYEGDRLIFSSIEDRLAPLLEYIYRFAPRRQQVVIFDKIMGNAAALLSIKAGCREVYSPLGSQFAVITLEKYGIRHNFDQIVSYIKQDSREEMCPMEKLSRGKDPEEFYAALKVTAGKKF